MAFAYGAVAVEAVKRDAGWKLWLQSHHISVARQQTPSEMLAASMSCPPSRKSTIEQHHGVRAQASSGLRPFQIVDRGQQS